MKYLAIVIFLILFSCKEENIKYLEKYPFFKNVDVFSNANTVSINNFESRKNKNGLEYLLNERGNLLEIRNWKNNHLNGYSYLYSVNNKISIVANFVNDTMSGSYFELDTLNGKLLRWSDKINYHEEESAENQNINFKDGKIDLTTSWFHVIKKINDTTIQILLPTKHQFPLTKVKVIETNEDEYIFTQNNLDENIPFKEEALIQYNLKNKQAKFITGTITYSLKPNDMNENIITGRTCYFKFKL